MRKFLIATAILLAASGSATAKLRVSIRVDSSNEKANRELREAIEARINSTERYTISTNGQYADLDLAVSCMVVERGAIAFAIVCNSEVTYYPYKNSLLSTPVFLAETMAYAELDNTSYVATSLMNRFINGTIDATLETKKFSLRNDIRSLCVNEPTECKMPRP